MNDFYVLGFSLRIEPSQWVQTTLKVQSFLRLFHTVQQSNAVLKDYRFVLAHVDEFNVECKDEQFWILVVRCSCRPDFERCLVKSITHNKLSLVLWEDFQISGSNSVCRFFPFPYILKNPKFWPYIFSSIHYQRSIFLGEKVLGEKFFEKGKNKIEKNKGEIGFLFVFLWKSSSWVRVGKFSEQGGDKDIVASYTETSLF